MQINSNILKSLIEVVSFFNQQLYIEFYFNCESSSWGFLTINPSDFTLTDESIISTGWYHPVPLKDIYFISSETGGVMTELIRVNL